MGFCKNNIKHIIHRNLSIPKLMFIITFLIPRNNPRVMLINIIENLLDGQLLRGTEGKEG